MYIYTPKKELTVTGPILLIFLMGGQLSSNAWQVTTSGAHHWSVSGPLKPNLSRQLWRGEHGNPRGLPQFTWKSLVMNLNPSTFMFWLVCCGLHFQLLRKFRPLSWKWEPFQRQIPCCTLVHSAKLPASSYQRYTQILHPKSPCCTLYVWLKPGMPKLTTHHLGGAAPVDIKRIFPSNFNNQPLGKQLILREYVWGTLFMHFPVFLSLYVSKLYCLINSCFWFP